MCGFLPLRANGGVSLHPVFSHPGDAAGLPPQLRRPHPGHHRGDHRGGRQGLPNVSTGPKVSARVSLGGPKPIGSALCFRTVDEAENNLRNMKEEEGRSAGILIN